MPYWLTWDDGTGRLIRAPYETQEEAETQAAADEEQFPGRGATVGSDEAPVESPEDPTPTPEPPAEPPVGG